MPLEWVMNQYNVRIWKPNKGLARMKKKLSERNKCYDKIKAKIKAKIKEK
jgi:hypothetical protein